jgi:thiol-disulfide isomerase/thioredoxin
MRIVFCLMLVLSALFATAARAGDKPEALCLICALRGETEAEEVTATHEFNGKTYSFCSDKCAADFAEDPDAWVYELPRAAPAFSFQTLAGENLSLESLRGQWVVVDFWATWCKPCVETMPALDTWFKEDGVRAVGVSIDTGKDRDKKVQKFLEKNPVSYPVVIDAEKEAAWENYKVKILPTILLIDPKGQIVARQVGTVDLAALRKIVAAGQEG